MLKRYSIFYHLLCRDFKAKFAGSRLGVGWHFLQPLFTFFLYVLVFGIALQFNIRFRGANVSFLPYFFAGFWPWMAFQEGVSRASTVLLEYAQVIKKMPLKTEYLVPMVVVNSLIYLPLGWVGLMVLLPLYKWSLPWAAFPLVVLPLCVQLIFTLAAGFFFAIITPYLKDATAWIPTLLNLWFFATPIFYSVEQIPARFRWIFAINPLSQVVNGYRDIFFLGRFASTHLRGMLIHGALSVILLVAAWWTFGRGRRWLSDVL